MATSKRKVDAYIADVAIGYGQSLIKEVSEEDKTYLASLPHPTKPDWKEASAWSYIEWMCLQKGWHKKSRALIEELLAQRTTETV